MTSTAKQKREMKEFFLKLASVFYGAAVRFRHILFDYGILKSEKFDVPIVCVGNITVGGTGKTPTAEMIIRHMSTRGKVALLSRGYGRDTKGYRQVQATDSYRTVGDEPLQIKCKFPECVVVVCEKRAIGVRRIMQEHPDVTLIVMDDGFQHRYVEAKVNVLLVDATRPIEHDRMLPLGTLRDTPNQLHRVNYFLVNKCPENMTPLDMRIMRKVLLTGAFQRIYFMTVMQQPVRAVFADTTETTLMHGSKVIAVSGIGNPQVFIDGLRSRYSVVDAISYDDHHAYRVGDMHLMEEKLQANKGAVIVMTEKDAVKIMNSNRIEPSLRSKMYYVPIEMTFLSGTDNDFLQKLEEDVTSHN